VLRIGVKKCRVFVFVRGAADRAADVGRTGCSSGQESRTIRGRTVSLVISALAMTFAHIKPANILRAAQS